MSVVEEFGGGERVKSLFLLSKNRLLTRGLPMDHGSGVYGSVRGKPEEEEKEEEEDNDNDDDEGNNRMDKEKEEEDNDDDDGDNRM